MISELPVLGCGSNVHCALRKCHTFMYMSTRIRLAIIGIAQMLRQHSLANPVSNMGSFSNVDVRFGQ